MAYLGQPPFQEFTNPPTKDSFTGDGSTTTFDMDVEVPSSAQNALEVYIDNVRQEPGTGKAFTLGPDGSNDIKRITFSSAPANAASIYVINDKTNVSVTAPLNNDLNGTELILDGDGDTSITADTDDRIDFRIAAADHFHIGTSSGDTVFQNRTDAKDFLFNQYDGRTILEINDAGYVAIANGATGPGQLRIYEDTDLGTNFTAFQVGTQAADITYTLPTADGSSGQLLTTDGSGVLSFSSVSSAADDLTIGDAAVLLTTSAGNITIDAAGNDTDIIFKGTDGGADRVFMTIDGSAGGDLFLTGGLIDLKNDGSAVSQIKFYCESSNAHAQTLIGAPHSESATNTLTLPDGSNGVLLSTVSTATVTNKTFTSPKLNEDVAVTTTATELNLIDGGATVGTTAIADGDGLLINDAGTMRVSTVQTLAAYLDDEITAMPNLVTTAATTVGVLGSGSIAAGFGNIDNGASNITSGGLVSLDVDADADDVTGDSATGRLTLGAGQDLNLYHGGTNSYIVNDTGDLILKTGASDEDMIFQGNDGGAAITALTLDMSAAGAATFNSTVAATGFIIGSANIGEAELEILDGLAATTAELTIIDGNTSATSTTVADADRVVMNDNGTMVQVAVTDLAAYFDDEITAMPNLITTAATTVGALDSGSITSGFTSIDVGAGAITTTGTGTIGNLVVDNITIDANTISTTNSNGTLILSPNGTGDVNVLSDALTIQGVEGEGVALNLQADQFDDNADLWSFIHAADNNLKISSYASGASVVQMQLTPNSTVMSSTTMVAGILDLIGTTDSSDASGDTGILRVEGGASIAKKLYVGTDLDVDGTTNLDVVDIDGAVDMATTLAVTGALTTGGAITTNGGNFIFNEDSADHDFRVESNGNANMLFVDGGANRVGIGTGSPDNLLHLSGAGAQQINLETTDGATTIIAIALKNSANTWQIENGRASNVLSVRSSTGGETIRAHANGVTAFNSGIALGVGLNNTAANVLDDYEEGTWTADIRGHTGSAGDAAQTGTTGYYVKIGNLVNVTFSGYKTNLGSWSGNARIYGLPFTCGYVAAGSMSSYPSTEVDGKMRGMNVPANQVYLEFKAGSRLDVAVAWSEIVINYYFTVSATYRV